MPRRASFAKAIVAVLAALALFVAGAAVHPGWNVGVTVEPSSDPGTEPATESPTPVVDHTPPEPVRNARPLAEAFGERVYGEYDGVRVFITQDGQTIALSYNSTARDGYALTQELHAVAVEYAAAVNASNTSARTLTVTTRGVQATVPGPTAQAYADGRINREAYIETIEVSNVRRNRTASP